MYMYINESENLYPRFPGDIQLIDPEWNVDKPLPDGWEIVIATPAPELEPHQSARELPPKKIDGVWHRQWEIVNLSEEELERMRIEREQFAEFFRRNSAT